MFSSVELFLPSDVHNIQNCMVYNLVHQMLLSLTCYSRFVLELWLFREQIIFIVEEQ